MPLMEWTAEVVRGWPNDGARERYETIKASTTVANGVWVGPQSDGTVAPTSSTSTRAAGLVVRGNQDQGYGAPATFGTATVVQESGANTNKAVVLWGNFVVRLQALSLNAAVGTFVPGNNLTVVSGKISVATGSDPVIGHVLTVTSAGTATTTANIVAVIY